MKLDQMPKELKEKTSPDHLSKNDHGPKRGDILKRLKKEINSLRNKDQSKKSEGITKYEYYPGEFREDLQRVKSVLEDISDERIDTDNLEKKVEQVLSLKEDGKYKRAIHLIHEQVLDVEVIKDLERVLKKTGHLGENELDDEEEKKWYKKVKKIRKNCENGEYLKALNIAESLNGLKSRRTAGKREKTFENKLERARKKLRVSRFSDVDLKEIKVHIKKGVEAAKRGKTKKAIENLDRGIDKLDDVFLFSLKLEKAETELKDSDLSKEAKRRYEKRLDDLQNMGKRGNFDKASSKIDDLISELSRKEKAKSG